RPDDGGGRVRHEGRGPAGPLDHPLGQGARVRHRLPHRGARRRAAEPVQPPAGGGARRGGTAALRGAHAGRERAVRLVPGGTAQEGGRGVLHGAEPVPAGRARAAAGAVGARGGDCAPGASSGSVGAYERRSVRAWERMSVRDDAASFPRSYVPARPRSCAPPPMQIELDPAVAPPGPPGLRIERVPMARYAEVQALNEAIFGERRVIFRLDRADLVFLLAWLDGRRVGYKAGYAEDRTTFYSAKGGVLEGYRRRGVARALLYRMM